MNYSGYGFDAQLSLDASLHELSLDQHRQQQKQQYTFYHQIGTSRLYNQRGISGIPRPVGDSVNSNDNNSASNSNTSRIGDRNSGAPNVSRTTLMNSRDANTRNSFGTIGHQRVSSIQDPISQIRPPSNLDTSSHQQTKQTPNYSGMNGQETINLLKAELRARDAHIESLESELRTLKNFLSSNIEPLNKGTTNSASTAANTNNNTSSSSNTTATSTTSSASLYPLFIPGSPNQAQQQQQFQLPKNIESIFEKLSESLIRKEEELQSTKETLEAILTSLALNPTNSLTRDGRYDVEAISHKILNRLEILTNENREMGKMLSYGRSQEMQISINLLQMENDELKKEIAGLKEQLGKSKTG